MALLWRIPTIAITSGILPFHSIQFIQMNLGTVLFLRGRGGLVGFGGVTPKKNGLEGGGPSKKNKGKLGSRKILPLLEGGSWEKI